MNVKCPYCGCSYDVSSDLLKNPTGNEKLGYGWWLRCYRCHKRWWLKNSTVEMQMNTPLVADKQSKIDKISKLKARNRQQNKTNTWKIVKYIILLSVVVFAGISYYNKDVFYNYLLTKAKHLSASMAGKLLMKDVKYTFSEGTSADNVKIVVEGKLINEDRVVAKLRGIKVSVFNSEGKELKSWNSALSAGYIVAGDSMSFSTFEFIAKQSSDIKVDVSIF